MLKRGRSGESEQRRKRRKRGEPEVKKREKERINEFWSQRDDMGR